MKKHGYENYIDDEVLAASPVTLVQMLYDGALDSIVEARRSVLVGDIRARVRAINKAVGIVTVLLKVLNHDAGGDLSRNLSDLYTWILGLLIEANREQIEAPLLQAEGLLSTIAGAWRARFPTGFDGGLPNNNELSYEMSLTHPN
jgi:flagellar secretion chaperone FliS